MDDEVMPDLMDDGLCVTRMTLPGTNMEVETGPLEDHFPPQTGGFPLPC